MSRRSNVRGFALVAVLWMLVAVGGIAVAFHRAARTSRLAAMNASAETRVRWAAREGLARAIDAVERFGMSGDWEAAGLGRKVLLSVEPRGSPTEIEVLILDPRSRLDLNHATPDEIQLLLEALLGSTDARVPHLRDAILDWRDSDHNRRRFGAEAGDYSSTDGPTRVANGPFVSIGDLAEVRGIDTRVLDLLRPYVTVYGDGAINVNSASEPVLTAVLGVSPGVARVFAERRRERSFSSVFEMLALAPEEEARSLESGVAELRARLAFEPQDLEVHVAAKEPSSGVVGRIDASVGLVRNGVWELRSVVEF